MVDTRWALLGALSIAAAGCRPDAGIPDYSGHVGLRDRADANDEDLPGPNPYQLGAARLALGAFYEGGSSDQIVINDADTHYYIFAIEGTGELTYSQEVVGERIEGRVSDAIVLAGTPWWGGGLIWDTARDLSDWSVMYISLRSMDDAFEDVTLKVQYEVGGTPRESSLPASGYGYTNDGAWHSLRVPLSDFPSFDLSKVRSPLILGGDGGATGETLLVDDFYFTAE